MEGSHSDSRLKPGDKGTYLYNVEHLLNNLELVPNENLNLAPSFFS
jgi:hypothetical protein